MISEFSQCGPLSITLNSLINLGWKGVECVFMHCFGWLSSWSSEWGQLLSRYTLEKLNPRVAAVQCGPGSLLEPMLWSLNMFFYQMLPFQSGFLHIFHIDRWLIDFKIISKLYYSLITTWYPFPVFHLCSFSSNMWVTDGSQKLCVRLGGDGCSDIKTDSCCVVKVGRWAG